MSKGKPEQQATDLDWFVISIQKIRQWILILVLLLATAGISYFVYSRTRLTPEQRAQSEITNARTLLARASTSGSATRPGSHIAQARDYLGRAETAFSGKTFEDAFRLAVESQSYSRRALGGAGGDETGDASLIFVEGDVSLQSAGRSTFDPARQRQALFDGDFIKTGRTGSAEIMFTDGTLYTIRPGSLFEVRRPTSSESSGSQVKMVSGAISVYTAAGTSTIATDAATASVGPGVPGERGRRSRESGRKSRRSAARRPCRPARRPSSCPTGRA